MSEIKVTGDKIRITDLLDEQFINLMGEIEYAYKNNLMLELDPEDGFILDNSIELLMQVIHENSILFNIMQERGMIGFEESTLQ